MAANGTKNGMEMKPNAILIENLLSKNSDHKFLFLVRVERKYSFLEYAKQSQKAD